MTAFNDWLCLNESANRYSVEITYRTKLQDVINGYAKLCLGFVSAALKGHNFHIKQVFNENPVRIIIATRNWDDGEWAGILSFNEKNNSFLLSKGFYNKGRKTVSIQKTINITGNSASDVTNETIKFMRQLEQHPARMPDLKPLKKKTGPKR